MVKGGTERNIVIVVSGTINDFIIFAMLPIRHIGY